MANHYRTATQPKARKQHLCAACHAMIEPGETHFRQTGYFEGKAFSSRYHAECWQALADSGFDEFTPGEFDPPGRIRDRATAHSATRADEG